MKLACFTLICFGLLFLSSCNQTNGSQRRKTVGVQSRIKNNPSGFNKLSTNQKKAAQNGTIAKGMSKNAVRLAWGKPNQMRRLNSGKEQWIYKRPADQYLNFPVNLIARETTARFDDSYISGSSIRHERVQAQEVDRTVVFTNGKVEAWTQLRD